MQHLLYSVCNIDAKHAGMAVVWPQTSPKAARAPAKAWSSFGLGDTSPRGRPSFNELVSCPQPSQVSYRVRLNSKCSTGPAQRARCPAAAADGAEA